MLWDTTAWWPKIRTLPRVYWSLKCQPHRNECAKTLSSCRHKMWNKKIPLGFLPQGLRDALLLEKNRGLPRACARESCRVGMWHHDHLLVLRQVPLVLRYMSGSQIGTILAPGTMASDISVCHNWMGSTTSMEWIEDKDATQQPTRRRTASPTENYRGQNISSAHALESGALHQASAWCWANPCASKSGHLRPHGTSWCKWA